MKNATNYICLVLATLLCGCAPAYHSYSGRYVDCKYCPPPPLPYTQYDECVCHSCAAAPHVAGSLPSGVPASDLEQDAHEEGE